MRNILLILTFISSISFAQTGINYQGAATDSQGNKLENQPISLKTSILQGGVEGSASYSETHYTTTDQFGLFNVVIGLGEVLIGNFDSIHWGADAHYLKVELDATGGTDYNLVSTTQMMSVPYAKYAENAGVSGISDVHITVSTFGDTMTIGNQSIIVPGVSFSNIVPEFGSVMDSEGHTYQTVLYGEVEWMTENLLTSSFNDGTQIPYNCTFNQSNPEPSWCYNMQNPNTEILYGKFYNGSVILSDKNICPVGWRVPSIEDWNQLFNLFITDGQLFDWGTIGNASSLIEGQTNESYLSLNLGGNISGSGSSYGDGNIGDYWTSNDNGNNWVISYIGLHLNSPLGETNYNHVYIGSGFDSIYKNIRCVKD